MDNIILDGGFDASNLPPALSWFCAPKRWSLANSRLIVEPESKTDFWQKTHYGFSADNGHFLHTTIEGDFVLSTRVRFYPRHQYDQAGLMVRFDADHWLKTSVEYELEIPSQLGAVVTNRGYSDWSTQPFPPGVNEIELRITRRGDDYLVQYRLPEAAPDWTQIRLARLHNPHGGAIQAGLYACSPVKAGYKAEFDYLRLERAEATA